MSFPSDVVLSAGTKLRVGEVGLLRQPKIYSIARGAILNGETTLNVTNFPLRAIAGTKLEITSGVFVTLADDALAQAGAQDLTILPYAGANLSTTGTMNTNILLEVLGGEQLSFTISDNEVTTRSFEDGLYDDAKKIMVGATIPWTGHYVKGDPAIEQIIQPAALDDREIYFQVEYPDGISRAGTCFIQGYTEENSMDSIRKVSWTFRVVGQFAFELAS